MKFLLPILILGLFVQTATAQSIFKVDKSHTSLDYQECQLNHKKILDRYYAQLDSQLERILHGISYERSTGASPAIIYLYKQEASKIILKLSMASILKDQLWNSSLYQLYGRDPKNMFRQRLVFQTDNLKFDMQRKIDEIIDRKQNASLYVLELVEHELLMDTFKTFGKNVFKAVGNGLVVKLASGAVFKELTAAAIESSLISFGVHVLKGAGIGTIISILKEPLMGSRPTPEKIWFDILEEYPEFVINPQWMTDAKSPDHPWMTHCNSIRRQPEYMTKMVKRFISKEENEFKFHVLTINNKKLKQKEDEENAKYPALARNKPQVADATYVYKDVPVENQIPAWATKK